MSSSSILPSRPVIPQIITTCSLCNSHVEFAIPMNPIPQQGTLLRIRCWKCEKVNEHMFYAAQISSHYPKDLSGNPDNTAAASSSSSTTNRNSNPHFSTSGGVRKGGRRIGTQERPLETVYYDTLGVPVTATTDEIKKAYRRLAIKHHPDKNPSDPLAADRFKSIAIAYQTLSDPTLRAKYNEFGARESAPEGGFVDPEEVFSAIFGGERFVGVIGHISLAKDMKAALQEAEEEAEEGKDGSDGAARIRDGKGERLVLSEEEKAKKEEKNRKKAAERAAARAERVDKLVANLERKLGIFTESATGINDVDVTRSWRTICELEAEELSHESYGPELLQAIGFVYVSKAKQFLATNQTFLGVGGWLHNVQGKYHVFSETVSTLRSALELKSVFDQIQAAEKAGNLSPEERQKLEEQAAEKGLQALFKGAKLEIDSVLREVCDRILLLEAEDPSSSSIGREKAVLRAAALQILGEAYMGVGTRKGGVGIQASSTSSADHHYPHSRTSSPAPGTHSKPEPSSTTANGGSGLGGIGTGLGNLGRDIGTGLGGMFGFGGGGSNPTTPSTSLSANASPSARRASRTFGGGQGRWGGQGGQGHGGSFDDSEYVKVDTKSSRARAT
ncbi:X-domain of DnaJ-containing-domain-containing protein [Lentinula edodes]|uniref:X-domain of DnaJ-containing-domain-containing protein n=1 Tax=Lentinula lateritia TaxID=40482 RepID=A0A9W9ASZ1_9AGAR|nr:X-domain of DnaJ-containing-domain-containing protein [Lentinula edodes]